MARLFSSRPVESAIRIRPANRQPLRRAGSYVLYWMIAARRLRYNFALDRAIEHCRRMGKPLLILEALRSGYPWSSDRMHKFVMDGMSDNAALSEKYGVSYYPYLEPAAEEGHGLVRRLGERVSESMRMPFRYFCQPEKSENEFADFA